MWQERTAAYAYPMTAGPTQAELHVFEEAGHLPSCEEPEAFDRVLPGFLNRARRAP